ncbi:TonB-dependent receptor [Segetibacter aerophilus]|uniref:TonB-dependent receptor n=1 Tax=Segetibacter aerophilus TaxID=670293 RepID=A0A512BFY5_9BACT|nr:TonB-dependent receptor [Segetibacter aerophilus]
MCQTGVLIGSVQDAKSKTPLELATVSILGQDSTLITYKLSDKDGRFLLEKLPVKKRLIVSVTYTGYLGHYAAIQLEPGKRDTLNVLLAFNNKDTNAVVVTTTVPIRMNGDTLEINPGAFKLKQDAVVEEVLNQVSGITIWSDGSITVNGKKVSNLLVDGKPFLGSTDTRVATQNLPKSAIDKIQLYQEYDRSNISQVAQPQDSLLTMNIKLKESSKKGFFGKAGAGYGTTDRAEADLSLQVYNKTSSGGIGGGFNNINKNIGNLQEMLQNNTYRNYNPNLYNVGRFGASGINKNYSIGGLFTHSFIETANSRQNNRVAITYNKSGTDTYTTDVNLQNRTTINNPQFIRDDGVQNNKGDRHDVTINYVKTNSYNDNLNVNGAINTSNDKGNSTRFTEVRDSANRLQSTNSSVSLQQRQTHNESLNLNFAKSDREDPIKGFTVQFDARQGKSVSDRDVKSVFQSFVDANKNTSYNRHYTTDNNSKNIGGSIDYLGFKRLLLGRYNLFGINLNFTQRLNYNSQSDDNQVTDFDSTVKRYIINSRISNVNKRELFEYTPSLSLSKNFNKYSDVYYRSVNIQLRLIDEFKTDNNSSTIVQRNLDRSFQFFRYEGNINYNYTKQRKYYYYVSAGYSKNFQYAPVDQLYTVVDDINVYDTRVGNAFLQNRINHTFSLNSNFNTQKPEAIYSVNGSVGGSYTRSLNPVVDSTINDPSGRRISYHTNADKSSNLNLNYNFNISRKVKKNNLQLMYDGRFNTYSSPNYIDRVYNISETRSLYNNLTFQFSLSSLLVLTIGESFQYYNTRQTAAGLTSFKNSNNTTRLGAVLNYPKNFTFSSTLDRVGNSNLDKPTNLWNAFASYRFMKQQGELKFSAMDILKQYRNITNSVSSYGTTTRITNGLQQYFLLTFSYYPRKFGKT